MLFYKYSKLCLLGLTVGHECRYSEFFLNQYFFCVNKNIIFYSLKKIIYLLFKFKIFLIRTLSTDLAPFFLYLPFLN